MIQPLRTDFGPLDLFSVPSFRDVDLQIDAWGRMFWGGGLVSSRNGRC